MYDFPDTRAANDALWDLIRANLRFGPDRLTRDADVWRQWRAPGLVLSQTCGLPFRARLSGEVALVGTPDYMLEDCPPGHYFSVILARMADPAVAPSSFPRLRLAYNEALSQSGWAAAHAHAALHGTAFRVARATGSHRASALAVAEGLADLAFLDAVTWRHIGTLPELSGLHVVGRTAPTPGLPLITAKSNDANAVTDAVRTALDQADSALRAQLGIGGLVTIPPEAYLSLPIPPAPPST